MSAQPSTLPHPTNLKSLLEQPAPNLDFVLPGLLRGTVGGLISPGGMGKSYWALSLALAIVGGSKADLTGLNPAMGKVLMLAGEDPQEILAQRLKATMAFMPKGVALTGLDYRSCFGLSIDLMKSAWYTQVVEAARGCRLLVLDTLTRFHSLDENSTQDMKALMSQLERLAFESGAAVLYLHHTSKASAMNGNGSLQQAARGSSVLVDNARWAAYLATMTEHEGKTFYIPPEERINFVRWNISKQNYGANRQDVWFRRSEGGALIPVDFSKKNGHVLPEVLPARKRKDGSADVYTGRGSAVVRPGEARGASVLNLAGAAIPEGLDGIPSANGKYNGQW